MKYLIVNGDDFGETPGITAGVVEAHQRGILTSTSMIVTSAFSRAAVDVSRELPDLSVGLHLCLTDNREQMVFDPEDRDRCRSELKRQFELFVEIVGAPPTHLDSHHNIHRDPRLLPLFLELAHEHSLPMREHSPVRYFSSFYGQWDGVTHLEQISVDTLASMLRSEVGEGFTELSCHPAYVDSALDSFYSVERETELRTLCDPQIRGVIDGLGIVLVGFRDVPTLVGNRSSSVP